MRAGVFSKGDAAATHCTITIPPRAHAAIVASSGGRTKYNRSRGILKSHARDAACVGEVGRLVCLAATDACNQGNGFYCRRFPVRLLRAHQERVRGFKRGDVVRADVPNGARKGVHWPQ
jgi:hypothetical protein